MKLLTLDADYAVRALVHLARNRGQIVSTREIARHQDLPLPYIRRLLPILARQGLVRRKEGKGGGYLLAQPPRSIRMSGILRILQPKNRLSPCTIRRKPCPSRSCCTLREHLLNVEAIITRKFDRLSVAQLALQRGD